MAGKSQFLMGKSTNIIFLWPCSLAMKLPEGKQWILGRAFWRKRAMVFTVLWTVLGYGTVWNGKWEKSEEISNQQEKVGGRLRSGIDWLHPGRLEKTGGQVIVFWRIAPYPGSAALPSTHDAPALVDHIFPKSRLFHYASVFGDLPHFLIERFHLCLSSPIVCCLRSPF